MSKLIRATQIVAIVVWRCLHHLALPNMTRGCAVVLRALAIRCQALLPTSLRCSTRVVSG